MLFHTMLSDQQDVRLFGLRYRTIFVGLTMIGSLIVALMILTLPSANLTGERPIAFDEVLKLSQRERAFDQFPVD